MDATVTLFSLSLLLLAGIYGIYWFESRRTARPRQETVARELVPTADEDHV